MHDIKVVDYEYKNFPHFVVSNMKEYKLKPMYFF